MNNLYFFLLTTALCLSSCSTWIIIPAENRHNYYPELVLSSALQHKDRMLMLELKKLKNEYELKTLQIHIYDSKILLVGTVPSDKINRYRNLIDDINAYEPRHLIQAVEFSSILDKTKSWSSLKAKFALRKIPNNLAQRIKLVYFNGKLYVFGNILPQEEVAIKLATGQLLEVKKLVILADIYQLPNRLTTRY